MRLQWNEFPDAPELGAVLCKVCELAKGAVVSKTLEGFGFLALLTDAGPKAFVNACPHQFLPLDHMAGNMLSVDGTHLLCSNHGAAFRILDGEGVSGDGIGCALSEIPVHMENGMLVVAG